MKGETRNNNIVGIIRRTIKDYFIETTIHGFRYIAEGRNIFEKLFWSILVVSGFVISGGIILTSLKDWDETPLQTTIDKVSVPVQEFLFPAITLYDRKSLQMPRRNRWMYLEALLNMIDIYSVGPDPIEKDDFNDTSDFLELRSIRKEIDDLLLNHYRKYEFYGGMDEDNGDLVPDLKHKDCWNAKTMIYRKGTCTTMLEFLILSEEENLTKILEDLIEDVMKSYHQTYPLPPSIKYVKKWGIFKIEAKNQVDPYSIIKEKIFPAYQKLYLKNHTTMKQNMDANSSVKIENFELDNEMECRNSSRCLKSLDALIDAWQKVCNAVHVPLTKDLGTTIANFNFLLEEYKGFHYFRNHKKFFPFSQTKTKSLHLKITKLISKLFPNLHLGDKMMFVDFLGLLGFETSFGSQQWTGKNYQQVTSILYPQFGFDKCNSNQDNAFKTCFSMDDKPSNLTDVCELSTIYCEWVYYLCHIKDLGNAQKDDTSSMNDDTDMNETGKHFK